MHHNSAVKKKITMIIVKCLPIHREGVSKLRKQLKYFFQVTPPSLDIKNSDDTIFDALILTPQ